MTKCSAAAEGERVGPQRILVIKLGALGDFVQAMGPFAAIRAAHRGAHVTLLTTRPFAALAAATPWFDAVWVDSKPRLWQVAGWRALRRRLRAGRFDRVYDLQTSDRSGWYFRLLGGGVEWSGIAPGCSHPHANPDRDAMHTVERQREQLAMAGIAAVPSPDLGWADRPIDRFGLAVPFALLCPGGAAHRPGKRWPADRFGVLAARLAGRGLLPVVVGGAGEADLAAVIRAACPAARDLTGQTDLVDLLAIGRQAACAIGNDTGPMHLIAAAGRPALVLFSAESDPDLCAPRGRVAVLRRAALADLAPGEVDAALGALAIDG